MTLTELIAGVEAQRKTLTVFNAEASKTAALREHFSNRNVDVTAARTADGPQGYAVLSDEGDFITAASVETVLGNDGDTFDFETEAYRPILDHLDETTFTSYDRQQMVAASHEIEDRAWRIGSGTVHAGFQTLSTLESQIDAYERLADRNSLAVHVYAAPEGEIPDHETVSLHIERAEEVHNTWFVVYDGGGTDTNKCALLAEEREPRAFYGFWTYDPDTVDWIIDHIVTNYTITGANTEQHPFEMDGW